MFKKHLSRYNVILAAAVLVPFCVITAMINVYAVNVPVTDQYALVPLIQKLDEGSLGFSDLWAQHNEHRIFFPRIVLLALAELTNWSIKAEIITSLIISLLSFIIITVLIRNTIQDKVAVPFVVLISGLWFFSPVQWQNWLWGWQLEWYLCIAASLGAFYFLSKTSRDTSLNMLYYALLCAFIATFSLGSGMFLWLAGFIVLALQRSSLRKIVIWLVSAATVVAVYMTGYKSPGQHSPISNVIEHPVAFIKFFLAYIGRPISSEPYAAILFGALILMVLTLLLWFLYQSKQLSVYATWVGIIFYALVAGALASASRIDLGIINALSSRYTAFSLLIVISMTVVVFGLVSRSRTLKQKSKRHIKQYVYTSILAVSSVLLMSSYYNGTIGMQVQSKAFRYIKQCSNEVNPTPQCLYEVYFPSLEDAKTRLDYLKSKNYGGY